MCYQILVTALIPQESKAKIPDDFVVDYFTKKRPMSNHELLHQVTQNNYDAILCTYEDRIDESLLKAAGERLKIISVMSNGIENVDIKACQAYGVTVTNVPGVTTDAIADYAIALLLIGIRRLDRYIHQNYDPVTPYYLGNLQGLAVAQLTIGIVGMGKIGSAIAKRLVGFDSRIIYYSRQQKPELEKQCFLQYLSLDRLLVEADAVIVCCSLNDSTHNMFASESFKLMKSSAIFINLARGAICNHQDLYIALKQRLISMALLDVTDPEPLPPNHLLYHLDNCLIFPHIATNTIDSRLEVCNLALQNILKTLKT